MFKIAFLKWNFKEGMALRVLGFLELLNREQWRAQEHIDSRSASQGGYWMGQEMLQINAIGEQKTNHAGAVRLLAIRF